MKIPAHNKLKIQQMGPLNGFSPFPTLFIFLMSLTTGVFILTAFLWYQSVGINSSKVIPATISLIILASLAAGIFSSRKYISNVFETLIAVSYTHLTLPTNREV